LPDTVCGGHLLTTERAAMAQGGRLVPMFTIVTVAICLQRFGELWQAGELFIISTNSHMHARVSVTPCEVAGA